MNEQGRISREGRMTAIEELKQRVADFQAKADLACGDHIDVTFAAAGMILHDDQDLALRCWDPDSVRIGTAEDLFGAAPPATGFSRGWAATLGGVPYGDWFIIDDVASDELLAEIDQLITEQRNMTLWPLIR